MESCCRFVHQIICGIKDRLRRAEVKLQNSPYFCVFKYARAVNFLLILGENRLFCSLG